MTTPGGMYCAKHPKEVTYLRCAACDTPICDRCSMETPVGRKCKKCVSHHNPTLSTPTLFQGTVTVLVALVAGGLAGLLLGHMGFYAIWIVMPYGRFVGTIILKVAGRKTGLLMDILTAAPLLIAGIGVPLLMRIYAFHALTPLTSQLAHAMPPELASLPLWVTLLYTDPMPIVISVITAIAAVSRLRFEWNYWGF